MLANTMPRFREASRLEGKTTANVGMPCQLTRDQFVHVNELRGAGDDSLPRYTPEFLGVKRFNLRQEEGK